jgi:hypothetical protein
MIARNVTAAMRDNHPLDGRDESRWAMRRRVWDLGDRI